ncbi:hypothetical protein [Aeromicrobium marinum]|uniref:hypothetical protein n=1 Tax=Aeromicrobium marinum TaxID=219314 RepID=UPI0002EE2196|nr:hypothetical protein [Aeromicrobium marinum]
MYRLSRGPALLGAGSFLIASAVAVFLAFVLVPRDGAAGWMGVVAGVLAVLALAQSARFALRSPVVMTLTDQGFVIGRPRCRGRWEDVEDVVLEAGRLGLTGENVAAGLDLRLIEPDQVQPLVREVYDRLNTANGYTRFR